MLLDGQLAEFDHDERWLVERPIMKRGRPADE
jgi:hypothetical protein